VKRIQRVSDVAASRYGFALVILFLVIEYARPQDIFGVLGALHVSWVIGAMMVVGWYQSRNMRMASSVQTAGVCLFLVLLALHIPFALNGFRAYTVAQGLLFDLPFFISILLFVDNFERLRTFFRWWSLVAIYLGVMGLLGGGIGGSGFLADENDFALLMNMMLPFVLCMLIFERQLAMRLVYLAGSLICVASVVTSNSRGGFVGLIATLAVFCLASPRKLLSLVLATVLGIGIYSVADQKYWDRISTIQATDEGTAKERTESWQAAWDMFLDHPLGVGPGNFPVHFPEYQPESMRRNMWGRQAHSLWFTLLAELGVPGVAIYAWLLSVNTRSIWQLRYAGDVSKENSNRYFGYLLSVAFFASLTGFFVSGTFLSVLYYPHFFYLTALIVVSQRITTNANAPAIPGSSAIVRRAEVSAIGGRRKGNARLTNDSGHRDL
jgi:hypothetical protein